MIEILRVISGSAKGLRLKTPKGMNTRPTTDRIKETLFNIIREDLEGAAFLDLFSGSASLGIEALSRGAREGVFIDRNPECVAIIKENLRHTGFEKRSEVYCADFLVAVKKLKAKGIRFSMVFLDPPYDTGLLGRAIKALEDYHLVLDGGLVIVERSQTEEIFTKYLKVVRDERYGATCLTFLRRPVSY